MTVYDELVARGLIAQVTDEEEIKKCGNLLYEEAMLLEGYEVKDKKAFVDNLNSLIMKAFH